VGDPAPVAAAARFARRSWRADGDMAAAPPAGGGVGGGVGGVPPAAGGVGPAPDTTAACARVGDIHPAITRQTSEQLNSSATGRGTASQPARAPEPKRVGGVIECCIPC
jgi:hypothetical protein